MITERELAAYLPYKLQLLETHSSKIGTLSNIYTLGKGYSTDDIKISIDYCEAEHLWMFKPILHPLSSLTKEITINGETFVPMIEMYKIAVKNIYGYVPDFDIELLDYQDNTVGLVVRDSDNRQRNGFTLNHPTEYDYQFEFDLTINNENSSSHHKINQYELFQKLAEWRIDFTNMIERGDAIAVSENFNPYK